MCAHSRCVLLIYIAQVCMTPMQSYLGMMMSLCRGISVVMAGNSRLPGRYSPHDTQFCNTPCFSCPQVMKKTRERSDQLQSVSLTVMHWLTGNPPAQLQVVSPSSTEHTKLHNCCIPAQHVAWAVCLLICYPCQSTLSAHLCCSA